MREPKRSEASPPAGSLALTRVGAIVVAVEGHRLIAFFEPGERDVDCDLAEILSLPPLGDGPARLLELEHRAGRFIMAVHGRIRLAASHANPRWQRPSLVDGVFRRACLRGVMWHESELVYLLDVEEVASRIAREERTP